MMGYFAAYWLAGCVLVGSALGSFENRCPRDPEESAQTIIVYVAAWPVVIGYALTSKNSQPKPCKVLP